MPSCKTNSSKKTPLKTLFRLLGAVVGCALLSAVSICAATVSTFTGGDPGEGLDLEGNFTYALNIGTGGPAGKVGDANFTSDDTTGATVIAQNEIVTWLTSNYGDTDNDKRLADVLQSIRWSAAPSVVTIRLRVENDVDYKLQLLFGESCCPNRGFNVIINGNTEVTDFMPGPVQAGDGDFIERRGQVGAVITHEFKAQSDVLEIILDGPAAESFEITDRNAIINGLTLERLTPVTDSDNDGLSDDWELKFFGNLDQGPADDPDNDGLTNEEELLLGTDPTRPDTDGDGLTDGDEVKKYNTDPLARDTDGDGLDDGFEVLTLNTDPTKADTDGDGFSDREEVSLGTNPNDPNSKPIFTTLGVVRGGDPGEGLDLEGEFIYALAIGAGPEVFWTEIRDAVFMELIEDEVFGATLQAGNRAQNWYNVNYGDSPNDLALATVTSSIRWSNAASAERPDVVLTLDNLETGSFYKIQMIFGEACCNRGFDVLVDEVPIVKSFNPGVVQGGAGHGSQTALITHQYFAKSSQVVIRLDGRNTNFPDRNALLNAVTVEKVAGNVDSDNDGLHDEWERLYFGNLDQTGSGDPDNDGLTNAEEFALGTNPLVADTDNDGLSDAEEKSLGTNPLNPDTDGDGLRDGDEVSLYETDPLEADTDGDGLSDGLEVLVYGTNPLVADTDGDGVPDGEEVRLGTDPLKAELPTVFSNISVGTFYGGDPGEGLDLQGDFLYAFNVGSNGAAGKAGDADFTADDAPGIKLTAQNEIPTWHAPEYGDTPNDEVIKKVMQSIRWSAAPQKPRVELTGLVPGSKYKLQLLFVEQCCAGRAFHIIADGAVLAEEFNPAGVHFGAGNTIEAAVFSAEFVTQRDTLTIILDGTAVTNPEFNDRNPILSGVTLEILELGAQPLQPPQISAISKTLNEVSITFTSTVDRTYTLEFKENIDDPTWETVTEVKATGATTTLVDNNSEHLARQGFWRLRAQ
jgi:hypothetical protein